MRFTPAQLRSRICLSNDEREGLIIQIKKEFSLLSESARESIIRELKIKKEIEEFEEKIGCKHLYARIDDFKDLLSMTCGLDELVSVHFNLIIEEQLRDKDHI